MFLLYYISIKIINAQEHYTELSHLPSFPGFLCLDRNITQELMRQSGYHIVIDLQLWHVFEQPLPPWWNAEWLPWLWARASVWTGCLIFLLETQRSNYSEMEKDHKRHKTTAKMLKTKNIVLIVSFNISILHLYCLGSGPLTYLCPGSQCVIVPLCLQSTHLTVLQEKHIYHILLFCWCSQPHH